MTKSHLSAADIASDLGISGWKARAVADARNAVSLAHQRALGPGARMRRIYFIQQGTSGPIKIGQAIDVEKRLLLLQCGNPQPLRLLVWFGAAAAVEAALHKHFRKHRLRGEWFRPTNEILVYVDFLREHNGRTR